MTIKVDGDSGAELWRSTIDYGSEDMPRALAIGSNGDVVVAGRVAATGRNMATFRLAGNTGNVLWSQIDTENDHSYSSAHALALGNGGDVYVTGSIDTGATLRDFVVQRLDGGSGAVVWSRSYNGSQGHNDDGNALRLLPGGDLVVGGRLQTGSGAWEASIRRLTAGLGTTLWHTMVKGHPAGSGSQHVNGLALAGARVVAAGSLVNGSDGNDLSLISLDVNDGSGADQPAFLTGVKLTWQQALLYVWPYKEARRLRVDIERGLKEDTVLRDAWWTTRPADLLRLPDRTVLLTVNRDQEEAAAQYLLRNRRKLSARTRPAHIFFLAGGPGETVLNGR